MASLFTINYNFIKGLQHARRLGELAQKLRMESDSVMAGTIGDLSANWKGENAQEYLKKYKLHQKQVRKRAEQLRLASETVRRVVINIYLAEMRSYMLAQQRRY